MIQLFSQQINIYKMLKKKHIYVVDNMYHIE